MKYFKYLILLNLLICVLSEEFNDPFDLLAAVDDKNEILPLTETTGACSMQLSVDLQKRNCRYGKCEQIKNGTDFSCHCDQYITGKRCDRPALDMNDACSSNPCWGDSLCITLDNESKQFKCLCTSFRRGKYCHIKLLGVNEAIEESTENSTDFEQLTSLLSSLTDEATTATVTSTISTTTEGFNLTSLENSSLLNEEFNSTIQFNLTDWQNFTGIFNSTLELKIDLAENSSTRVPPNTFIPKSDYQEKCNFDTCQLGKCLVNGTCECIKPAFGKFCDKIDECLVLNCVNGSCVTGKGCVCEQGFTGVLCETEISTTTTTTTSTTTLVTSTTTSSTSTTTTSTTSTTSSTTTTTSTTTSSTTTTTESTSSSTSTTTSSSTTITSSQTSIRTSTRTTTSQKPSTSSRKTTTKTTKITTLETTTTKNTNTTEKSTEIASSESYTRSSILASLEIPTTQIITNCENGGLLIDNVCICLNQYTGIRCEIVPSFSDNSPLNLQTKEPELDSIERDIDIISKIRNSNRVKSESSSTSTIKPEESTASAFKNAEKAEQLNNNEELIPIFTISRYNTRNKNLTVQRNLYWPWFECFPGNSRVYAIEQNGKKVKSKLLSELNIDDQVLVADDQQSSSVSLSESNLKFSKVVSFLHKIENIDANFIRIYFETDPVAINKSMATNKSRKMQSYITITPRHLILVRKLNQTSGNFEYRAAMEVRVGDVLKYFNYNQKMYQFAQVVKTETVNLKNSGIYAPLTESGTLIVDNVQTSCYSLVKDHKTAQFFFNILNKINHFLSLTADSYVTYSKFLYEILNFVQLSNLFLNVNV